MKVLLCNSEATITIADSTITKNQATNGQGGGIYNYNEAKSLANSRNTGTYHYYSGSSLATSTTTGKATITINNSTLLENTATGEGGAIYNKNLANSDATSHRSNYGNATATSNSTANTTITVTDSTIAKNTAGTSGGGIYTSNTATSKASYTVGSNGSGSSKTTSNANVIITVSNSTIANNKALNGIAGGIYNYNDATGTSGSSGTTNADTCITLVNATLAGNTATSTTGGIYTSTNSTHNIYGNNSANVKSKNYVYLLNSIAYANYSGTVGHDIYFAGLVDDAGNTIGGDNEYRMRRFYVAYSIFGTSNLDPHRNYMIESFELTTTATNVGRIFGIENVDFGTIPSGVPQLSDDNLTVKISAQGEAALRGTLIGQDADNNYYYWNMNTNQWICMHTGVTKDGFDNADITKWDYGQNYSITTPTDRESS